MAEPINIIKQTIVKRENGIIFLSNENTAFEETYIKVRQKEGWLYTAEQVRKLPFTSAEDTLQSFWKKRKASADKFRSYLATKNKIVNILEVGCGNGWFTGMLATAFPLKQFAGLDVNKTELQIAAAAFDQKNINWFYGDLREEIFMPSVFDMITFNASIQYFDDLQSVISSALLLLRQEGELHILDSPFYTEAQHGKAVEATKEYYKLMGAEEMSSYYFHHRKTALSSPDAHVLYKPGIMSKIRSALKGNNYIPFPWIRISKSLT